MSVLTVTKTIAGPSLLAKVLLARGEMPVCEYLVNFHVGGTYLAHNHEVRSNLKGQIIPMGGYFSQGIQQAI